VTVRNMAAIAIMALSVAVGHPAAQTTNFQAKIPFAFVVNAQTLPAGVYIVQRLLEMNAPRQATGVVVIRTADERVYLTAITSRKVNRRHSPNAGSNLSFIQLQGKNYLNQIRIAGDTMVYQFARVPAENNSAAALRIREVALTDVR
jgi:type IV secretory pathway protease TraF